VLTLKQQRSTDLDIAGFVEVHGKRRNGKVREGMEKRKEKEIEKRKVIGRNCTTAPHKLECVHASEIQKNILADCAKTDRYYRHLYQPP